MLIIPDSLYNCTLDRLMTCIDFQVKQAESVVCAVIKLSSLLLCAEPLENAATHSPDLQVLTIHVLFVKYF